MLNRKQIKEIHYIKCVDGLFICALCKKNVYTSLAKYLVLKHINLKHMRLFK